MLALAGAAWLSSLNGGMTIMKRTIYTSVSVLALFAAAPVLAQTNVSTIEQSESNNRTTVEQAGVNASSYVNQSGVATAANPNKVDVSQKGNGAESFVAPRSEENTSELKSLMRN